MNHARIIARFEAIGSQWWVGTRDEITDAQAELLADELVDLAEAFNQAYSRFLPGSLVTRLNRDRQLEHPPIELVELIATAETMRQASDGAFNIGVGQALEHLGYDAAYSFAESDVPPTGLVGSAFTVRTGHQLALKPGINIDLGGLGKGWLIDKLAAHLHASGLKEFFVNGGGDIMAYGELPKRFAIENPFNEAEAIGEITITAGALAASAPNRRAWTTTNTGRSHHHLINPATGASHTGVAAVHVSGPTATLADMASTALYVMPSSKWDSFSAEIGIEYLAIDPTGRAVTSPGYPGRLYS